MATSETTAQPDEQKDATREATLHADYHGKRGCIIRLNEDELEALGVDVRQESVEYGVIDGDLAIE